MVLLSIGLVVFLGMHSIRIVAEDWRSRVLASRSEGLYKGLYSLVSLIGLVMIVIGYARTRADPDVLWHSSLAVKHVASLLMLAALILLAATYVPRNRIRERLGHPMLIAVKLWAVAHLLANGRSGDVILFGAFLLWAVVDFASARRRDRLAGVVVKGGGVLGGDVLTVMVGAALWLAFVFGLHRLLFGVSPLL